MEDRRRTTGTRVTKTFSEHDVLNKALDLACEERSKISGSAKLFRAHFIAQARATLESTRKTS